MRRRGHVIGVCRDPVTIGGGPAIALWDYREPRGHGLFPSRVTTSPIRRRRSGSSPDDDPCTTGMLGILSVMLLLIPALLLMVHVTAHAAITVSPPLYGGERPNDGVIRCGGVELEVAITHDGFFTQAAGSGWQRLGAPAAGLDHRALEATARAWKHDYPHDAVAFVSAEADIPYSALVATLDTLRGRDCRLAGAMAGEEIPEACLLWQPIVRDRAPNLHVPAFRRGTSWPPEGAHALDPGVHAR